MAQAARKRTTDAHEVPKGPNVKIPLDGSVRHSSAIDLIDGPHAMARADELAFMEEFVEVCIATTTDRNAENPVQTSVNGRNQFLLRGKWTRIKRKYLERLALAREVTYKQAQDVTDPEAFNILNREDNLKYPFSVRNDSERGQAWLQHLLETPQ